MSTTIGPTQVSALLKLGADAMDNLFDIWITFPPAISRLLADSGQPDARALAIRCEGFEPPVFSQGVQGIKYKSLTVNRPTVAITGNRFFKLNFRLDAYHHVYALLKKWRYFSARPELGFAMNGVDRNLTGSVVVSALQGAVSQASNNKWSDESGVASGVIQGFQENLTGVIVSRWAYNNVWISDLSEPGYKTGNGGIQMISATFQFAEQETPQVGIMNDVDSKSYTIAQDSGLGSESPTPVDTGPTSRPIGQEALEQ